MSHDKMIFLLPIYANPEHLEDNRYETIHESKISYTPRDLQIELSETNSLVEDKYSLNLHSARFIVEGNITETKEAMIHHHPQGHTYRHLQFKLKARSEVIRIKLDALETKTKKPHYQNYMCRPRNRILNNTKNLYISYVVFRCMKTCVFCKIIKKELPAYIFYDDGEFIAFLDKNPNVTGMSLVAPKKHYSSDVFEMPDDVLKRYMIATKKVVKILEKKLKCKRVGAIMEGMGLNHVHIKLYPMHGLKRKYERMIHPKRIFFKKYPGYLTSLLGPKGDKKKLEEIYKKLVK